MPDAETLAKLAVLAILVPAWWPVARALWREVADALREEGGLFGRRMGREELRALREERRDAPSPLVSEPRREFVDRLAAVRRSGAAAGSRPMGTARRERAPRRTFR